VQPSETRYAKTSDGAYIAYTVAGEGPPELIEIFNGTVFPMDAASDQPLWQSYVDRLASFARLIRFDLRGIGLSDPISGHAPPIVELWASDALAVLDDVGSERAALLGDGPGGAVALFLAATHPERVQAVLAANAYARIARADDYPEGVPSEVLARYATSLTDPRVQDAPDDLVVMAPRLAGDPAFAEWWHRTSRRGASPATASAIWRLIGELDVRRVLPQVRVPTLVLHTRDNQYVRAAHSQYLAEHVPGAVLVELPGSDFVPWAAAADFAGEIEEFLTGVRHAPPTDRLLATVLFTDIVGSTEQAAAMGDRPWRALLDLHDRTAHARWRATGE